jgi:transcriptional regulator GlxA family with amidase domain
LWDEAGARYLAALLESEILLVSEGATPLHSDAPPEIGAMINFLEQNFHRPVRISELAAFAGRSESHLTKVFHRYLGKSPKQYLQDKRWARARELLHTSNLSIAEVGQAIGMPNAFHFSRSFHQVVGEPPLAYRRKHPAL